MKVLVTGAKGFIGKHLCEALKRKGAEVLPFDVDSEPHFLEKAVLEADFIVHLAGINRPLTVEEFYDGNANLTKKLVDLVLQSGKKTPIIFSSSIQATLDNDYGKSKKMGEDFLFASGLPVYVYRLANVYGRGCRPNYNSAAATFCYNIAHDLSITIRDRDYVVHYNYVEDIVSDWMEVIFSSCHEGAKNTLSISITDDCSLGHLADLLRSFKEGICSAKHFPKVTGEFERKLFKTFCGYLSEDGYSFNFAADMRGSFEELYKSKAHGQISENVSFPGITKGGHYHTYKKEIFYTVKGRCLIRQRNIETNEMLENIVEGGVSDPVEIKVGYTHEIKNIGTEDSYTLMWISEVYDPSTADTYRADV